jgi:hypothetical protein
MADTAVISRNNNDGISLEEELNQLLSSSSSSSFSVASYLNLALGSNSNDDGVSSSTIPSIPTQTPYSSGNRLSSDSSNQPDELQRRMAELALQLQIQTQSCHEGTLVVYYEYYVLPSLFPYITIESVNLHSLNCLE